MKTFRELTQNETFDVAELSGTAVRILWVDDFYDGPLSGIAEWNGRRFRFEIVNRSVVGSLQDDTGTRRYWLIALSAEQLQEEERWQELFCTHVWTGFDYTDRAPNNAAPSEHAKFYEPYGARKEPDYSDNEVVGWFQAFGN